MGPAFWLRRFLTVFAGAFLIIGAAQALKGHTRRYATSQGVLWGGISASLFTATRLYRSRKGQACALCQDTPQTDHDQP